MLHHKQKAVLSRCAVRMLSLHCLGLMLANSLLGCGDERPNRVPVSGQVLIDGQPVTSGYIRFIPKNARPSGGKIGTDGKFTLTCFDGNDGVVLGMHRVEVSAAENLGNRSQRWHAPKKYANYATSGIKQVVDGPTNSMTIELTWDGGKPFIETVDGE